jgi:hypothetical protein
MKIKTSEDCVMFCSHIHTVVGWTYDPHRVAMKIASRDYTKVVASEQEWREFQEGLGQMLYSYRRDQAVAIEALCVYYKAAEEASRWLFAVVDSFANMTLDYFKKQFDPFVVTTTV